MSSRRSSWRPVLVRAAAVYLVCLAEGLSGSACPLIISALAAGEDASIVEAQKIFKQFVELERAYDPAQADLFSATAVIKDTRIYQEGPSKTLTWTGENYKLIIKAKLPVARARAEQYVYSQPSYSREGNNVRIKCNRSLPQKKISAPMEMLVGPNGKGSWKILEESSQSQP